MHGDQPRARHHHKEAVERDDHRGDGVHPRHLAEVHVLRRDASATGGIKLESLPGPHP